MSLRKNFFRGAFASLVCGGWHGVREIEREWKYLINIEDVQARISEKSYSGVSSRSQFR